MRVLCRNPYTTNSGMAYGCGQCMPCRYNRRRIWAHRIMLEAAQYNDNAFVTLTYEDDPGTLVPKDAQDWLKRLRFRTKLKLRYYLVGEYGDESMRPHYHAAVFGLPTCRFGQSHYRPDGSLNCCSCCELVRDTWGKGRIHCGTLEGDSAGYLAGYVTKKMTAPGDSRLGNRHPEFGRMSLRPGIGHAALWELASQLMRYDLDEKGIDVPGQLRHGRSKVLPLGRYLQSKLREMVGRDAKAPQAVIDKIAEELLPLRLTARSNEENPSFKAAIIEAGDQKVLNMEAKRLIFKRERML